MKHFSILLCSLIISTSLNGTEEPTNNVQKSTWYLETTFKEDCSIRAVALDTLGDRLAMRICNHIHTFKINTQETLNTFTISDPYAVRAMCFNHQDNQIAYGADNTKNAYTIDLTTKEKSSPYNNKNIISAITFNQAGDLLAVAASNTARIFKLPEQKPIASFHHSNSVVALCFNNAGTHLITASANKSGQRVRVFDINTKQKINSFKRPRWIWSILCNAQEEILTVEFYHTMHICNTTTNQTIDTQIGIDKELFSVYLNPNTQQLALGLYGEAYVYTRHIKPITALFALKHFTHDGKLLPDEIIYYLVKFMLNHSTSLCIQRTSHGKNQTTSTT